MAASNALFWTTDGWDGTESMMVKSRMYCERRPDHKTIQLFSISTGKSIIVTAQGIQAIALIINGITRFSRFFIRFGMPNIFFPFAILGLVRLCAAPWLTDDYTYLPHHTSPLPSTTSLSYASTSVSDSLDKPHPYFSRRSTQRPSLYSLPAFDFEKPDLSSRTSDDATLLPGHDELFHPRLSRRGLTWRIAFLLLLTCLWLLPLITMLPFRWGIYFTGTLFSMGIFYFVFLSATLFSAFFTIFSALSTSTIHPYARKTWYKVYTVLLFGLMVVLIVVACVENRKTPCGAYTSYPSSISDPHDFDFDEYLCGTVGVGAQAKSGVFGLAMDGQGILVREFEGWCVGSWGNGSTTS